MKILRTIVAEDSDILRATILKFLQRLPQVAVVGDASNGAEAVQCVDQLAPDLLILDINLPKLNGWQVLSHLQERRMHTEVILFSAYLDPLVASMVQARGAFAFVSKDDPGRLAKVIAELAGSMDGARI